MEEDLDKVEAVNSLVEEDLDKVEAVKSSNGSKLVSLNTSSGVRTHASRDIRA